MATGTETVKKTRTRKAVVKTDPMLEEARLNKARYISTEHDAYQEYKYAWKQMRDTVEGGADTVKKENEIYLPMPEAMRDADEKTMSEAHPFIANANATNKLLADNYPWHHPNKIYQSYLQRARFPDITLNAFRGIVGLATRNDPEILLPKKIDYLIEDATEKGETLAQLYSDCIGEVINYGKFCLIVDIKADSTFYISLFGADTNTNWVVDYVDGTEVIKSACFIYDITDGKKTIREYYLDENGFLSVQDWKEGLAVGPVIEPIFRGTRLKFIPVYPCGSLRNCFEPNPIPLRPISDVAIEIYQERADLRQAHFKTCNPTLFLFGFSDTDLPTTLGSNVVVACRNPNGKAEYPNTDTSALDHILGYIKELYLEAAMYGAGFIHSGSQRESGEALSIKQAEKGINLVKIIRNVSSCFLEMLRDLSKLEGLDANEVLFVGNTEFSEMVLTAQDISSIVTAWMNSAVDHDTVINALRTAGYVDSEVTNDEIKTKIFEEDAIRVAKEIEKEEEMSKLNPPKENEDDEKVDDEQKDA